MIPGAATTKTATSKAAAATQCGGAGGLVKDASGVVSTTVCCEYRLHIDRFDEIRYNSMKFDEIREKPNL